MEKSETTPFSLRCAALRDRSWLGRIRGKSSLLPVHVCAHMGGRRADLLLLSARPINLLSPFRVRVLTPDRRLRVSEGGREGGKGGGRRGKGDSGTNNCNVDWMSGNVATTTGGGGVLRDLTTGLLTLLLLLPIFWVRRWWRLRCPRASRHLDRTFRHGFGYLPCNNQSCGLK